MGFIISIIIPTYNRNDDLEKCLASIRENSRYNNEIIVLNPFCDNDLKIICEKFNVKLVKDGSRCAGRRITSLWAILNKGIDLAENKYVCWLNDDCVVLKDWDVNALKYFDKERDIELVVMKTKGLLGHGDFRVLIAGYDIPCANYAVLDKLSGIRFDENYSWFYGDADISFLTVLAGKKVVGTTEDCIIHSHLIDKNRIENEMDNRSFKDRVLFENKWDMYKYKNGKFIKRNMLQYSYIKVRKAISKLCKLLKK